MTLSTIVKVSTFSQGVNGFKWLMKKGKTQHKLYYHKIDCGQPVAGDYQSGFTKLGAALPFFPGKKEYQYVVDKENPNGYFEYEGTGENICYGLNFPTDAIPKEGGYELSVDFEAKNLEGSVPVPHASTTVGNIFDVVPQQTAYTWDSKIPELGGWRYYAKEGGVATVTGLTPKPVQGEEGQATIGFSKVDCPKDEPTYRSPEGAITIPKDASTFNLLGKYSKYEYQATKEKEAGLFSYNGGEACFAVTEGGSSYSIVVEFFGHMGEEATENTAKVTFKQLYGGRVKEGNTYTYTPGHKDNTELCGILGCWTYYNGKEVLGTARIKEIKAGAESAPKKCCGSS